MITRRNKIKSKSKDSKNKLEDVNNTNNNKIRNRKSAWESI